MASEELPKLQTTPKDSPKPEDLDTIANFMDSILRNMKSHFQTVEKNKKIDSFKLDTPNLECKTKEMLQNVHKLIKTEAVNKKQSTNTDHVKRPDPNPTNSQNVKGTSAKKRFSSAPSNTQKKFAKSGRNVVNSDNPKNVKPSNKQESPKPSIQQKASPRKMQVVYKENDKFVTRSLISMLKNSNTPQKSTDTKNKKKGKIAAPARTKRLTSKSSAGSSYFNKQKSMRTLSQTSRNIKPLILPPHTANTNNRSRSVSRKQGSLQESRPSLYVPRKDVMEKQIRRSNYNLRPMSTGPLHTTGIHTQINTRAQSLNTKPPKKLLNTQNRNKPKSQKSNKRANQCTKAPNQTKGALDLKQSEIIASINFQNGKTETLKPTQNQNNSAVTGCPSIEKSGTVNILNFKPDESIKFMKNTESKIPQKNFVLEKPKEKIAESSRGQATKKFIEMGDNSIKLINKKLLDIIDKIKGDKKSQIINNAVDFQNSQINANINVIKQPSKPFNNGPINPIINTAPIQPIINPAPIQPIIHPAPNQPTINPAPIQPIINPAPNQPIINPAPIQPIINPGPIQPIINPAPIQPIINPVSFKPNNPASIKPNNPASIKPNNPAPIKPNNPAPIKPNNPAPIKPLVNPGAIKKINTSLVAIANSNKEIINKNNNKIFQNQVLLKIPNSISPAVKTNNISTSDRASKQSIRSCLVSKTSNQVCRLSNRTLSILTPMEIIQDFINLVNRAKRERKTFTVCGNYQSIRKAFAERGWVEKIRINLIDDRDAYRKLEGMSNFELVEGIKDREHGDKYRRIFLSKLLAGHQVDFYWDYMTNPFNINNDRIKKTLINRFPFGATRSYTSKIGLCESLREAYWYYIEGYSNILFPRTYNLNSDDEIQAFTEDFRRTAVISLLQWISNNSSKPQTIISPAGQISTSVFNFATSQCYNFLKIKEHKDIDEIIPVAREYEWDIFLEKFYKIVHQGSHFKESEHITAPLLIDQSRYILNKIRKYVPHMDLDGIMNLWMLKPSTGSRGCGIHVCRTLKYTLDTVHARKDTKYVIQKYLERPMLIHNTKFDIRQWFLVTCMPNVHVWIYKDCYLRFSSQMYDLSRLHESIHLTNNSIQCRYKNNHNRSNALPDQNMWHSDNFRKYLADIGEPYTWRNVIYKGMKECLIGLFMLCQDSLITRVNSFELCGADFMLAEDFRPYLIEINSRPALYSSTKVTAKLCPQVLEDVVKVTIDYARNPRASTGNFELIYKDTFNYIPPKNMNTIIVEGISHVKFAGARSFLPPVIDDPTDTIAVKETNELSGNSIQKILNIDPQKVRKDVKNTLEKILAIIHSEKNSDEEDVEGPDENKKHFRMMLSEFVDIITCVKKKSATNVVHV